MTDPERNRSIRRSQTHVDAETRIRQEIDDLEKQIQMYDKLIESSPQREDKDKVDEWRAKRAQCEKDVEDRKEYLAIM